jgi:hypothetical protein
MERHRLAERLTANVPLLFSPAAETNELDGKGSDDFGTDKWSSGIRRPAANIQRWFEGQGEFSAFVVYTWLAVASASLVIVIILVRYRHEVSTSDLFI